MVLDEFGRGLATQTLYDQTLQTLESFFSRAMLAGYGSGSTDKIIPHRNTRGWKQYEFTEGKLTLLDEWGLGTGRTWISVYDEVGVAAAPVWVMHYEGEYDEEFIPLVKLALAAQYRRGTFRGGRGPDLFVHPKNDYMIYQNRIQGTFRRFWSDDLVTDTRARIPMQVGNHSCWGGMLV